MIIFKNDQLKKSFLKNLFYKTVVFYQVRRFINDRY